MDSDRKNHRMGPFLKTWTVMVTHLYMSAPEVVTAQSFVLSIKGRHFKRAFINFESVRVKTKISLAILLQYFHG